MHILAGTQVHPLCEPRPESEILAEEIRSDFTDIVRWTDDNSTRSTQRTIGPSELGDSCDRKIAYRLAGIDQRNQYTDPLPAIVGTSVHTWLEKAYTGFQQAHYMNRWLSEVTVRVDSMVTGHVDLFDTQTHTVIDFKTLGTTKAKDFKTKGPSETHIDQVNLYAMGLTRAGYTVRNVALIGIPRAGWLSDVRVWVGPYEPERAQRVLDRMYAIGRDLLAQGDNVDFSSIPANPGRGCSFCDWYVGGMGDADMSGCPGNASEVRAKFSNGLIA